MNFYSHIVFNFVYSNITFILKTLRQWYYEFLFSYSV